MLQISPAALKDFWADGQSSMLAASEIRIPGFAFDASKSPSGPWNTFGVIGKKLRSSKPTERRRYAHFADFAEGD
jgi:hypothetical protein